MPTFDRLKRLAGLDSNVGWTLMHRLVTVLSGAILISCVALFLSEEEQGYYYTFSSIISVQVLFDLGLAQVLTQIVSHEFPFLTADDPELRKESSHWQKLIYFGRLSSRWYLLASILFVLVASIGGAIYFRLFGHLPTDQWLPPLLVLVLLTGGNLYLSPRLSFIDGAGFTARTASMRFFSLAAGSAAAILLICAGLGLWALTAIPLFQLVLTLCWLRTERRVFNFFDAKLVSEQFDPAWRRELLHLQWRVAVSWLGGYFATMTITPILFASQGAKVAGQWGLTFSLLSQVTALGISWATARAPLFGELIARGDRAQLDQQFLASTKRSLALVGLGCMGIIVAQVVLERFSPALAQRLLDLPEMVLLAGATVANALVLCFSIYIRAHKEEPLVRSSIAIGITTTCAALILAGHGLLQVILAYALVSILMNASWRYIIYRSYARRG